MEKTQMNKEDYNNMPVFYCTKCKSLKIRTVDDVEGAEYCEDCGSVEIESTSIENWDLIYVDTYGHHYLEEKSNKKKNF